MTRLAKGKVRPLASTGCVKAEETARAIAKGAAANPTYVAAVLTMNPVDALVLVIGFRSECLGVLPPRLLQGHSPSGEPQCMASVGNGSGSGENLVNDNQGQMLTPMRQFSSLSGFSTVAAAINRTMGRRSIHP